MNDALLGMADAAEYLGLKYGTVRHLRSKGEFAQVDDDSVPDRPRWLRPTLDTWKEDRTDGRKMRRKLA